jgi:hypothetical protein
MERKQMRAICNFDEQMPSGLQRKAILLALIVHCALCLTLAFVPGAAFRSPIIVSEDPVAKNVRHDFFEWSFKKLTPSDHSNRATKRNRTVHATTAAPLPETHKTVLPSPASSSSVSTTESTLTFQVGIQPHPEASLPIRLASRPNFNMVPESADEQLRESVRSVARDQISSEPQRRMVEETHALSHSLEETDLDGPESAQILSDTESVNFGHWLRKWQIETNRSWYFVLPSPARSRKTGIAVLRFKVLPDGRIQEGSVVLEHTTGDAQLDKGRWGALVSSNYEALPREFHGPYIELRAYFTYNLEPSW